MKLLLTTALSVALACPLLATPIVKKKAAPYTPIHTNACVVDREVVAAVALQFGDYQGVSGSAGAQASDARGCVVASHS